MTITSTVVRCAVAALVLFAIVARHLLGGERVGATTSTDAAASGAETCLEPTLAVTLTVKSVDPRTHKVLLEAEVSPGPGDPLRTDVLREGDEVRAALAPGAERGEPRSPAR